MCGISGSNKLEKALTLYKLNLSRGSHSSGFLAFSSRDFLIEKTSGAFKEDFFEKINKVQHNYNYFLFHSRAPTNSINKTWSEDTTHPFKWENYYVAHNGVINNFKDLEESKNFEIDSSIIPYLLYKQQGDISSVYSSLSGLTTSWIFDSNFKRLFLAKAGSTLWIKDHSFSSTQFEEATSIKQDGMIYNYSINFGFSFDKKFNYKKSYFLL